VNKDIKERLVEAAIHYDCDSMRQLLAEGADFNAVDPAEGTTPFSEAVYFGASRDCITDMLRLGAKPDVGPSIGGTPLIYAAWGLDFTLIEMLLDAGADPNTPGYIDEGPTTPLDAALAEHYCRDTEPEHKLVEAVEALLRSRGAKCYYELKAVSIKSSEPAVGADSSAVAVPVASRR